LALTKRGFDSESVEGQLLQYKLNSCFTPKTGLHSGPV